MIYRQSLGWAALAALVIGSGLSVLLGAFGQRFFGGAWIITAVLTAALATAGGTFAGRTGPGKAAFIGGILLTAAMVVLAGLVLLAHMIWNPSRGG
jgi:hypothetical protein